MIVTHPDNMANTFDRAITQRDVTALRALVDESTVQRSLDGELVSGDGVVASFEALMDANVELTGKHRFSVISGDVALIVADFVMHIDAPDGKRSHVEGTVTNVLRRHDDGGWRFAVLNPRGIT